MDNDRAVAAEGEKSKLARVTATIRRDGFDGTSHRGCCNGEDAICRFVKLGSCRISDLLKHRFARLFLIDLDLSAR
ncbi:hypothetical protein D3C71_1950420 [compost metagenome]